MKKFESMSTAKLKALYATASEEDQQVILSVLESRGEEIEGDTEGEVAEEAEASEAPASAEEGSKGRSKKVKLPESELLELAEQLRVNINHRCEVVPFNTAEWVKGYIAGIIPEKRAGKVLYAVKTDDGRRIVKVYDSQLIRIFDEVIEAPVTARRPTHSNGRAQLTPLTEEEFSALCNDAMANVGKQVKVEKLRTIDANGQENVEYSEGRIIGVVPDKRTSTIQYRIQVNTPTEADPTSTRIMHKRQTAAIIISEEFDEAGKAFNEKYFAHRAELAARTGATAQERVRICEEAVKKTEEMIEKLKAQLEIKRERFAKAKEELDEQLKAAGSDSGDTDESLM